MPAQASHRMGHLRRDKRLARRVYLSVSTPQSFSARESRHDNGRRADGWRHRNG